MKPRWKLAIFDWDGTLADSTGAIIEAMRDAAIACELPVPEPERVLDIIGLGLPEAIYRVWPGISEDQLQALRRHYSNRYVQSGDLAAVLFPGVEDGLIQLGEAGLQMAVATGKSRRGLDRAFSLTGLHSHFHDSRCADEGKGKPDPDMLEVLLARFELTATDAVMIGDTEYDLDMAARIGMDAIGVSYGAHDVDRLLAYNPVAIAHAMEEVVNLILDQGGQRDN